MESTEALIDDRARNGLNRALCSRFASKGHRKGLRTLVHGHSGISDEKYEKGCSEYGTNEDSQLSESRSADEKSVTCDVL